MNGQKVLHKVFGEGIITNVEGNHITVSFPVGEKKFIYPDAFRDYLSAKDFGVMADIEVALNHKEEALRKRDKLARETAAAAGEQKAVHKNMRKTVKVYPRANVAFKCNYCDGGKTEEHIGFYGVCSDAMIQYNIETAHHVWCCSDDCSCRKYHDGEISRSDLERIMIEEDTVFICYESTMLRDWKAGAGIEQTGINKGKPMRLMKVQPNSLAVLTTRDPESKDEERYIFAVFLVDETYEGDHKDEGYVTTKSEFKIQMTKAQALKLKFWNYYFNPKAPHVVKFGSGLHRYLSDDQAVQILRDIVAIKKGTPDESLAVRFFEHFCRMNAIDAAMVKEPAGALKQ